MAIKGLTRWLYRGGRPNSHQLGSQCPGCGPPCRALLQGGRTDIRLDEVPIQDRAPIIRRYCQVATSGRVHIPVDPDAPVSAFESVAARYPVFRIVPQP